MAAVKGLPYLLALFAMVFLIPDESSGYAMYSNTDRCTIYQGGCAYHVVVSGKDCMTRGMMNDQPMASPYRSPRESGHENTIQNMADTEPKAEKETKDSEVDQKKLNEDLATQLNKMEDLEKTLVKMMEGLSVRSLRHIRQIKSNLKKMTNSIDNLKLGKGGKAAKIECPNEFIGVGTWQSCYRFSTFNATWHEAREYCSAFGAELVSLDTMKEAYIVDYLIKSHPDYELLAAWWTSGNYIVRNRQWMWTTMHHLKPIRFSRWAPGEPDARSTMHCLIVATPDKYQWRDAQCTDKHNFICEIENE